MISKKSQTYAKALFETEGSLELLNQLKSLSQILTQREILNFFLSFTISFKDKKELLEQALKTCSITLKNFFFILLENKSFPFLPQIVQAYQGLLDEKNRVYRGTVFSPHPISEEQEKQLEQALQKFFNKKIELQQKKDKKLIGGLLIDMGGVIFNNTVQRHIKNFKS